MTRRARWKLYQGMKRLKRVFSSTVTRYGLGDGPRGVQIFELKP